MNHKWYLLCMLKSIINKQLVYRITQSWIMLFKHIKSKEKVSTIIESWIMNIRNLIHSLQLDEVNQTWPPDMIPGHIQRILVDQEMVQNVHEMSRRSRKCVMGLWTFVWRSMKCVNRYRKWLQTSSRIIVCVSGIYCIAYAI